MHYWLSTKNPNALDRKIDPEIEKFLRFNKGIDSALLAVEIGLSEATIDRYKRHMGLKRQDGVRYHITMRGHNRRIANDRNLKRTICRS